MSEAPAFQFYPGDFLADENQMLMELAEVGAYVRIMCVCWREGSVPTDMRKLAKIAGTTSRDMAKLWPAIALCFEPHPSIEGRVVHPRLERERRRQESHRDKMRDAGKKGAKTRWKEEAQETAESSHRDHGQAMAKPELSHSSHMAAPPMARDSSSAFAVSLASALSSERPTPTATDSQRRARDGVKGSEALAGWLGAADNGALDRFIAAHALNAKAVDSIRATYAGPSMQGDKAWGGLAEGDRPPVLEAAMEATAAEGKRFQANTFQAFVEQRVTRQQHGRSNGHGAGSGRDAGSTRAAAGSVPGTRKARNDFR